MTLQPIAAGDVRAGVIAGILAYTFWGFFPIYFILLRGVAADEVLAARILFSVPVGAAIIWARSQWGEVRLALGSPALLLRLAMSAVFIALNWLVYIFAVQDGHIFEASLGYYINPLIYVLVGVVVLKERLRPTQTAAVALATVGVLILTLYGGHFPAISLTLAISFTIYGYIRKRAKVGAMPGLFIETLLLAPIAAFYLFWLIGTRDTALEQGLGGDIRLLALLLFAGPATVIPLLMFALAARRLTLATLGFLQFIGPTLQFMIGMIDGEPFTRAHQFCFGFIWIAVAIFVWDAWHSRSGQPARPVRPA